MNKNFVAANAGTLVTKTDGVSKPVARVICEALASNQRQAGTRERHEHYSDEPRHDHTYSDTRK